MTSMGDSVVECRLEAVKSLTITNSTHSKLILTQLLRDDDASVKKMAITKILTNNNFPTITSRERMEVLEHLFKPSESMFLFILINVKLITKFYIKYFL